MMRRQIMTAIALAGMMAAKAADYQYLNIEKADGTSRSLTAVGLTITYSNGNLTATNGTETATFALSDVSRMYFSNTQVTTGIADLSSLQEDENAIIYDLNGRQMAEGRLSTLKPQLKKGVYLVKQNEKTVKVQVR